MVEGSLVPRRLKGKERVRGTKDRFRGHCWNVGKANQIAVSVIVTPRLLPTIDQKRIGI